MRLPVQPLLAPGSTIDVHETLVRAIEQEIAQRFAGNPVLNRLEAEAQLAVLLGQTMDAAPRDARDGGDA